MLNFSIKQGLGKWLAIAALLACGLAMAQSEPTLKQVYDEAQAGRVEQAQVMMQQVLVAHPGSAKAHFVQAELFARQGKLAPSREALATAEKLAPGLPFAKAEAVTALRAQLSAKSSPPPANNAVRANAAPAPAAPASPFPWGLALALGGGAIALIIFLQRKKEPAVMAMPQGAYANPAPMHGGLSGQQGFGAANNMPNGMNPAYGQPAYGQPGYGQPQGNGMGGRIMGGLATGLAVGAGVMAAQAIGKSLMGNDTPQGHAGDNLANNNGYAPVAANNDMGGQNFGLNDASSWDDNSNSMASNDGGGDWDS